MSLEYKDYYAILGVPRTATEDEIKKAFRKLARQYHPDVAKDKKVAEERFKEINEAYEVLGSAENRQKYDRLGADWKAGKEFRPPPGWERRRSARAGRGDTEEFEFHFGGTGFSDFFEAMFGGRSRNAAGSGFDHDSENALGGHGGDVEGDIMVSLDEVVQGSVRTVTQHQVNPHDGRVERTSFQVRIPPGIREGQRVRVAGKGEHRRGGKPGDLYLRVRLAKHPDFRVRDADLLTDVVVAPWEAVLGATISVPSLEGTVSLRVPAGSRNGQQLRLRDRGLPSGQGSRGDLYVVLMVDVPSSVTDEERALWEALAAKSKFQPRAGS